jgi:hypothetical protein
MTCFRGVSHAVHPVRVCCLAGGHRTGQEHGRSREVHEPLDKLCEHVGSEHDERWVIRLCTVAVSCVFPLSSFVFKYSLAPAQNGTFAFSPPNTCSPSQSRGALVCMREVYIGYGHLLCVGFPWVAYSLTKTVCSFEDLNEFFFMDTRESTNCLHDERFGTWRPWRDNTSDVLRMASRQI